MICNINCEFYCVELILDIFCFCLPFLLIYKEDRHVALKAQSAVKATWRMDTAFKFHLQRWARDRRVMYTDHGAPKRQNQNPTS